MSLHKEDEIGRASCRERVLMYLNTAVNNCQKCLGRYGPFTTLEIADSVQEDKTVAHAYSLDNATGYVILSATGVCLVDGVEITTRTLDLERIRLYYLNEEIHIHLSHEGYLRCGGCMPSSQ